MSKSETMRMTGMLEYILFAFVVLIAVVALEADIYGKGQITT